MNQSLSISNSTIGATRYAWEFCSSNLKQAPTVTEIVSIPSGYYPVGMTNVFDGTNYYGFYTNAGDNTMFRLDYKTDFKSIPTIVPLGNLGNALSTPFFTKIIKEGTNWMGLVVNGNNTLLRLNFGTSLSNANPVVSAITLPIALFDARGMDLINDQGNYIALIANVSANQLSVLNFGNSLSNTPTGNNILLPDISGSNDIAVMKDCDTWYGLITASSNNKVIKVKFGSSLMNLSPLVNDVTAGNSIISSPLSMALLRDGNDFVAFLTVSNGNGNATLAKVSFGNSLANDKPQIQSFVNNILLSPFHAWGMSFLKLPNSEIIGTTATHFTPPNNKIYRILLSNSCSANVATSDDAAPANVSYSQPGKYYVSLTATDANGNAKTSTDSVVVLGKLTPEFTFTGGCSGAITKFKGTSTLGTFAKKFHWDFGMGRTSSEAEPEYQFPGKGSYPIRLVVTDGCGRKDSLTRIVTIVDPPVPNFSTIPLIYPNSAILFKDDSSVAQGDTVKKWLWNFGDPASAYNSATQQNPQHVFSQTGSYLVSLTVTGSSGCPVVKTKLVQVKAFAFQTSIPDTVCIGQSLNIINNTPSIKFNWDFCLGDLLSTPVVTPITPTLFTEASYPAGMTNVFDGTNYYGFLMSAGNGVLFRLDYKTDFKSQPSLVSLGNFGGALNIPIFIKIVKEGSNWIGIITNSGTNTLVRINFGASLSNTNPTISTIPIPLPLAAPRGMELIRDGSQSYAIVTNLSNNQLSVFDFGNSFLNDPTGYNISLPGASGSNDVSVAYDGVNWYGLVTANPDKIFKINFGNSLSHNTPKVDEIVIGNTGIITPLSVSVLRDGVNYVAFLSIRNGVSDATLARLNFGNTLANNNPAIQNFNTTITISPYHAWGISFLNLPNSEIVGTIASHYDAPYNQIFRIALPNICSASVTTSTDIAPVDISYSKQGKYYIDLTATDINGNTRSITDSVVVQSSIAPSALFSTDSQCIGIATRFIGPTDNTITSWKWDFGDDSTDDGQQVSHQYKVEGSYLVTLTVQGSGGCNNQFTKSVTIYNNHKPTPQFSFPTVVCTNAPISFTDQSVPFANEPIQRWRWDFGDGQTATEQNPVHIYSTQGDFLVTLSVSGVSGCDSTFSQKVTILPGANVSFTYSNVCPGEATAFTNMTTPDGEFLWNFGEATSSDNTSTLRNPLHTYAVPGLYTVSLSATTPNGCVITQKKQLRIGTTPVIDFVYSKVCASSAVEFTVSELTSDTTTTALAWDFGDPGSMDNLSTDITPSHSFTKAGTYTVGLTLTTSLGCQGSVSKVIEVKPSALADFSFASACATQPVAFTNASVAAAGDPINQWSWNFGDNSPVVSVKDPVHTFTNPGTYTVTLTLSGSQSDCKSTVTKQVKVNAQPKVDFIAVPDCQAYGMHFSDKTTFLAGDNIKAWEWNFGGQGTSNFQHPTYNFSQPGDYIVTLKVTMESGCTSSISRSIKIEALPEADFRFTPDFRAAPMEVLFTNDSRRAIRYQWDFGDGAISTDTAPRHTYTTIGEYTVTLLAYNTSDCANTLTKVVHVNVPVADAKVRSIIVDKGTGSYAVVADILNTGTVPLTSLELSLASNLEFGILEKWTGSLNPNQSLVYPFKGQLTKRSTQELPYLCVEIGKPNGLLDPTPDDGRYCASLLDDFAVLPAYPSPTSGVLTIPCIFPDSRPVIINVYDIRGKSLISFTDSNTKVGFNEFKIDLSFLSGGLYLLQVGYEGERLTQRIIKVSN